MRSSRRGAGAEHRVEHVLGVADEAGAAGEQVVGAGRGARGDRAGDGAEVAAEVRGEVGGDQRAGARGRLDHDRHPGQRRHDPVAGGEGPAPGGGARRQLGEDQALLADPPPERAVGGRVGDVGAAAEHGDRAAGVERAAVGAGVDAEGEAADDDHPGRRQLPPQLAGDLAAVGGGAAGADDRSPRRTARGRRAGRGRRGRSAPRARRRRRAARPGRGRRGGSRPSTAPPASSAARWRSVERRDPAQQLGGDLRRRGGDQVLVAEAQQFRRARAERAGRDLLDVGAEQRPAARSGAGSRGRRGAQPRSRLRSCSAWAICSSPIVSAAGEVGDRLRQPQRPVVGAAAEPLPRVELRQQRRRPRG